MSTRQVRRDVTHPSPTRRLPNTAQRARPRRGKQWLWFESLKGELGSTVGISEGSVEIHKVTNGQSLLSKVYDKVHTHFYCLVAYLNTNSFFINIYATGYDDASGPASLVPTPVLLT